MPTSLSSSSLYAVILTHKKIVVNKFAKITKYAIIIFMKNKQASNLPKLNIIYETDDVLVINKPHNLSCIPSRAHLDDNLGTLIKKHLDDNNFTLRVINRLDKDTAGIVVVAKSLNSYKNITITNKEYYALCKGTFDKKTFTINQPIHTLVDENGHNIMKRIISSDGKPAITHVEVLKEFDNYSLIKLTLETGRTHQIRVHLSSIGHPLVGDPIYNKNCDNTSHTFLLLKKATLSINNSTPTTINVDFPEGWNKYLNQL